MESILEDMHEPWNSPNLVLEIGPHPQLLGAVKDIIKKHGDDVSKLSFHNTLARDKDGLETLLQAAAQLFGKGVPADLGRINFPTEKRTPQLLTDLPAYPWQHKERYWHHSRINENHLHSQFPRDEFLGALSDYSDGSELTWRNILDLDEMPWLRDHRMQDLVVFPMAGYLVLAMKAVAQQAMVNDERFERFELREITISRPLVLQDNAHVEIMTQIKPYSEGTQSYSDMWNEFHISSYSKSRGAVEHARGLISIQGQLFDNAVDGETREERLQHSMADNVKQTISAAQNSIDAQNLYHNLEQVGCQYGPCFQGLSDIRAGPSHSLAVITASQYRSDPLNEQERSAVIHPSFLDVLIQSVWPILGAGSERELQTLYMPSSMKRLSVAYGTPTDPGVSLKAFAYGEPDAEHPKATHFTMRATDMSNTTRTFIQCELVMTPLLTGETESASEARKICYKIEWQVFDDRQDGSANGQNGTKHVTDISASKNSEDASLENTTDQSNADDSSGNDVVVIGDMIHQQALLDDVTSALRQTIEEKARAISFDSLPSRESICIVVLDLIQPFLKDISENNFQHLREMLLNSKSVLWVTRGITQSPQNPYAGMIQGLLRSVRSETDATLVLLDLDTRTGSEVYTDCDAIMDVYQARICPKTAHTKEMEFSERAGQLLVPRYVEDEEMNSIIQRETQDVLPFLQPYVQPERSLELKIGIPGALDTLYFTDDRSHVLALPEDYVEIKVMATGMNFKDIVISMGQVASPYIGVECSGIVSRIGSKVSNLVPGDRVMAMTEGAYSTYARCPATSAAKVKDDMTFETACTIPVVFYTAYYSLVTLGRLGEGDKVLIHAAAGGVGQAAIQIAKLFGAEIFATVGSPTKKALIMEKYGITEERIFYSRDTSFGPAIRQETKGYGVDVVLNSLAGDALRESWNCLAHFGRFIEIGKRDITNNTRLEMAQFEHNATFASVDLTTIASERPRIMQDVVSKVCQLFDQGQLTPIEPISIYPISRLESAFRQLQSGKSMGKLVINWSNSDQVKAVPPSDPQRCLRSDATYIVIGGTGSLGRSAASWMSERGAGNIVLLSRSGTLSSNVPQDFLRKIKQNGTKLHTMPCDVSDEKAVTHLIRQLTDTLPPVRGIIHGAMVLRDTLFERMLYDDFKSVVDAKVPGAWHFHNAFVACKMELDFIVYMSSIAGIVGNRGQAAYASANTFLDAFAAYQRRLGLPATSINLTAIADVGYLAENEEKAAEVMRTLGGEVLYEREFLALLHAGIDGSILRTCEGQSVTGLQLTPTTCNNFWAPGPPFSRLRAAAMSAAADDDGATVVKTLRQQLTEADSLDERVGVLCGGLSTKLAAVLMLSEEDIEPSMSVSSLGLDSLVGIEVRNWILRECEANLQVLEVLTSASLTDLAGAILKKTQMKFT